MFSGAVRAVFRKKKGFGFVKILHWLLLVLFSAAAALARLRLLAVGFDADGLPVPMDLNAMALPAVLIVAAVIAVIMAQRYPLSASCAAAWISTSPLTARRLRSC